MKRYYIAYGSNLNIRQMNGRCPGAKALGVSEIKGWQLLFRGSKTGAYLTIEESYFKNTSVPVAVYEVTKNDEYALDIYEGFPKFYYKKDFRLTVTTASGAKKTVTAFAYIMDKDRPLGIPAQWYMDVCREGYDDFNLDKLILERAYNDTIARVLEEVLNRERCIRRGKNLSAMWKDIQGSSGAVKEG